MTNGLTKSAKARSVPPIPSTPGIPSTPARFVLPPSPPGMRYEKRERWTTPQQTEKEVYFELVKLNVDPASPRPLDINLVNGGFGIPLNTGDKYVWGYANVANSAPTVFRTVIVVAGPNASAVPSNPPANMVLVEVMYTPATPTELPTYPSPSGVQTIKYPEPTWPNGYPRKPDGSPTTAITGTIQVPKVSGGYEAIQVPGTISRSSTSTGLLDKLQITSPTPINNDRYRFVAQGVPYIVIQPFAGAPGTPYVPGYLVYGPVRAWDAGANSIATVDGDLQVIFRVPIVMGVKVGFFPDGARNGADADALRNAFYVFSTTDGQRWAIIDNGRTVQGSLATATTKYEIRRVGGVVYYFIDDALVFTSSVASSGPLRVGSTLYKTGDMVL